MVLTTHPQALRWMRRKEHEPPRDGRRIVVMYDNEARTVTVARYYWRNNAWYGNSLATPLSEDFTYWLALPPMPVM